MAYLRVFAVRKKAAADAAAEAAAEAVAETELEIGIEIITYSYLMREKNRCRYTDN